MRSNISKQWLLALLTIILAFNYVDRFALGLVLQDIKVDLDLSDTQLGLLSGIAFALFYSVLGIPIARWADRGNRVTIITVTTTLWSAAVALCGAAGNFVQLMMIRVGVAVGEAGCIPPAHSLIADYFTREERPRAVARYMLGLPLALVIGYFGAGWLNEIFGWRMTFVLLGLPGLVLAALAWLTLKEPRCLSSSAATAPTAPAASPDINFKEVCVVLWANRTLRHLLLSFSVWFFFGYGIMQWMPAFFIRTYDLQTGELGTWFALVNGVCHGLCVYLGGELATRYAAGNERRQLRGCAAVFGICPLILGYAFLAPNHYLAFGALAVLSVAALSKGPIFAVIQTVVPAHLRATSIALIYMFANLIGMGLGPLLVGALSDALAPLYGADALRYALVLMCPGYAWAAWHMLVSSRTVAADIKAASLNDPDYPTKVEEIARTREAKLYSKADAPGLARSR